MTQHRVEMLGLLSILSERRVSEREMEQPLIDAFLTVHLRLSQRLTPS